MRSKGSIEFSRMPGGIVKISERLGAGASKSSVSAWRRGDSLPSDAMRERIFEQGGPDPAAWDEAPDGVAATPTPVALAALGPATADDTATEAALLLADIRASRARLDTAALEPGAHIRAQAQLAAMVDKLGHHTGVKLTVRQILDSPHFITIADRLIEALEPWPEAMRSAADAIDELKAKP